MEGLYGTDKKSEIIRTTWKYLLKAGIPNASVGNLCRETGISQSSLYYWFENKDDIWINAGKYGLTQVVEALFVYTFKSIGDIRGYFDNLLNEVDGYKYELRLAVQITTSSVFGERMREKTKEFNLFYERYSERMVSVVGCSYEQAETFVYSIVAFVIDYVIWDDREKTQMLLENLYRRIEGYGYACERAEVI